MVDRFQQPAPGRIGGQGYAGLSRQAALRSSRSPQRTSQDRQNNNFDRTGSSHGNGPPGVLQFGIPGGSAMSPLHSSYAARSNASRPGGLPPRKPGDNNIEAEMYERKRQQDLRKQIQEKERELESMSHNKDRMKQRLSSRGSDHSRTNQPLRGASQGDDTLKSGQSAGVIPFQFKREDTNGSYKRNSNSPLRRKDEGRSQPRGESAGVHELDQKARDKTPPTRLMQEPMRDNFFRTTGFQDQNNHDLNGEKNSFNEYKRKRSPDSPLRHKSGSRSPTRKSQERDGSKNLRGSSFERPQPQFSTNPMRVSSNEYLNQLYSDNASLQRRLNLVLAELDRVNRDKSNLLQKSNIQDKEITQMKNLMNSDNEQDKINSGMQLDVTQTRDQNIDVKRAIEEADQVRSNAIQRLRTLQAERDRKSTMNDELKVDFQKKIQLVRQIEQEQFHSHEKIQKLNEEIEILRRQQKSDDNAIADLQVVVDRLSQEREELMQKLQELNRTYDNCVMEITRERSQMQAHNHHHNQLLIGKVLFTFLDKAIRNRKAMAMNEFFSYCKFDGKCHSTLQRFVKILERLGQYKLRIGLKQWYQKTYKPVETLIQTDALVDNFRRRHLLAQMLNLWRNTKNSNGELYGAKTKAIAKFWNIKVADAKKDVMRAFTIWASALKFDKLRRLKTKRMVWKAYNNRLAVAFETWKNFSQIVDQQVRLHVLAKTFAHTQLLRITFNSFRLAATEVKRKRINRLRTFWKGWKESRSYNKYMMAANLTSLKIKQQSNENILKACFDAMRQDKEETIVMKMEEGLDNEFKPQIEACAKEIKLKEKQAVQSGRVKSCKTIEKTLKFWLRDYFRKWKEACQHKTVQIDKNLRERLIRMFRQKQRDAFDLWKNKKQKTEQDAVAMKMEELTFEAQNIQNEVDEVSKQNEIFEKQEVRSGRVHLGRATKILRQRMLKRGIDGWKNALKTLDKKGDGADRIIARLKRKMLRKAFNLYKEGVVHARMAERNDEGSDHLAKTIQARRVQTCLRAWREYSQKFKMSRHYWSIVFTKMDTWMRKRAFNKWVDGRNHKAQNDMQMKLMEMQEFSNDLQTEDKELALEVERNANIHRQADQCLKKQVNTSIAHNIKRMFYANLQDGFSRWKNAVFFDRHRDQIMKHVINLLKTSQARIFFAAFKNNMIRHRANDEILAIKQVDQDIIDQSLIIDGNSNEFSMAAEELHGLTNNIQAIKDKNAVFRNRLIENLTKKNQTMDFQSNLRHIFNTWRNESKRSRNLANTLANVMQKSLQQSAFETIKQFALDKEHQAKQHRCITKIRRMFWKANVGYAMSKWRETEFIQTQEMIQITIEQTALYEEEHAETVRQIKKRTCDKSLKTTDKKNKARWFQSWKAVTRWLKNKRVSTQALDEAMTSYTTKRLIKKWKARTDATTQARGAIMKFDLKRDLIYTKAVFRQFQLKHHREKSLILRLSSMASKFDNKMKEAGFQAIQNFVLAKNDLFSKKKSIGSSSLKHVMLKFINRNKGIYFEHYRKQVMKLKQIEAKRKMIIGHWLSKDKRFAFLQWKHQAKCATTLLEVNEEGPVVEEVLEAQMNVFNLKKFMKDEGFTERQIQEVAKKGQEKSDALLAKAIGRWRNSDGSDNYLYGKVFARWKKFAAMRKTIAHWLDFMENRQSHVKSDLAHAFNKWKYFYSDQQNKLQKCNLAELKRRAAMAAKVQEQLAGDTQMDEDTVNDLNDQNDLLFESYKKSQRLALALCHDKQMQAKAKTMSILLNNSAAQRLKQMEGNLREDIGRIAALKDKMNELENDNDSLAKDNEELRQFSLDGYQLSKNMQSLTAEREKLSVDLADKAKTIKNLFEENERLQARLGQAMASMQNRQGVRA